MIRLPYICLIALLFGVSSCGIYSFSGASISNEVKSVSINPFENVASLAPPVLSNTLTEALKDKFSSETNLIPLNSDGDLIFSGRITNYSINPIAIQADETASKNRLSITVKVKFVNIIDEESNYDKTFSRYADYESSQDFTSIEESLNEEIVSQLIDDIFNEAFTNW
ncbi:MAG: LptE family protein [Flavobacteriales bacterium]